MKESWSSLGSLPSPTLGLSLACCSLLETQCAQIWFVHWQLKHHPEMHKQYWASCVPGVASNPRAYPASWVLWSSLHRREAPEGCTALRRQSWGQNVENPAVSRANSPQGAILAPCTVEAELWDTLWAARE